MATQVIERLIDLGRFPFVLMPKPVLNQNGIIESYDGIARTGMKADLILTAKAIHIADKLNIKKVRVKVPKQYDLLKIEVVDYTYTVLRHFSTSEPEEFQCDVLLNDISLANITEAGSSVNALPIFADETTVLRIDNDQLIELSLSIFTNREIEFEVTVRLVYDQYYKETVVTSGGEKALDTDPSPHKFSI